MKLIKELLSLVEASQNLAESTGANYAEQLAHQIFGQDPSMSTAGNAEALLKFAYSVAEKELGARAKGFFRDGDFLSDFVSTYHRLQKQGVNEAAYADDLDPNKKIVVSGVKGMASKPFTKKFKNMAAYDTWCDSDEAEDCEVDKVMNEAAYADDLNPDAPILVQGVRGMESKPFKKKFKNMAAFEEWLDTFGDDCTPQEVTNA